MNSINLMLEKIKFKNRLANPTQSDIDNMSYQYALFTANVKKSLPSIRKEKYKDLFLDLLYHKWLSLAEQYNVKSLRRSIITNNTSYNLNDLTYEKPLIFAAFHLGSYRLYNSFLYEQGFKIVLIIEESVYIKQQSEILENVMPMLDKKKSSDFVILNVKDRTSIFKLKNLINQGYVMSVYLDGNTGLTKDNDKDFKQSYIPINLFNCEVFVKNGVGKLASLLDADIIPVISHRDEKEKNHIVFHKEISISDFKNKKDFATKSIEIAYQLFEEKLKKYPAQWEIWLYLHNWIRRNYTSDFVHTEAIKNKFNDDRYIFFKVKESYFLFDLFDYKSYPLELETYKDLVSEKFTSIDNNLKNELIMKNVII
jgi:lauroyl/myristoyl acyltransferase